MSQDDQRNQPNDEPARDAAAAAGSPEPIRAGVATRAADAATGAGDTIARTPTESRRREFRERGEGVSRYAIAPEAIPLSGSEESWSAAPHPGYQPDPAIPTTNRRLMTAGLVGLVVLAAASFAGYGLLTAKSSNGNGPAPWTGAVQQNGAVVGGINAQNNGAASPVDLPSGVTFGNSGTAQGASVNQAVTACRTAANTSVPVTTATGTAAEISAWGNRAGPTADDLHAAAATLQRTLNTDAVTVAHAAYAMCVDYSAVNKVPPMPDAVGSQAWAAAVRDYAQAANQALQGVSGKPAMLTAANDSINAGNAQLAALSARVNSVT